MEHAEHGNSNAPMEYQSETGRLNILGFWIFLGAEIVLFSTLFATFFVLKNRTAGGVLPDELFEVNLVMIMTFLLLISSFTCGIAVHEMRRGSLKGVVIWTIITLLPMPASSDARSTSLFTMYMKERLSVQVRSGLDSLFYLELTELT